MLTLQVTITNRVLHGSIVKSKYISFYSVVPFIVFLVPSRS